jgi:hypothetical protein
MTETDFLSAMHALAAYVDANIRDLDAEQARLDALLGRTDERVRLRDERL